MSHVAELRSEVRRAVARLRHAPALGSRAVEEAAQAVQLPELSGELVAFVIDDDQMVPLEHLVCALALRSAVGGTALEVPWRLILAWRAADAIYDVGDLTLFQLRLDLLDEVLADPAAHVPRARLLFQRANTRQAIGQEAANTASLVDADLRQAYELAYQQANLDVLCRVLLVMASRAAASATSDLKSTLAVDARAEATLEIAPTDDLRALLHRARAIIARASQPDRAVEHLERALTAAAQDPALTVDLATDLVVTLTLAGHPEQAVNRGRELLSRRGESGMTVADGLLHAALGQALTLTGETDAARHALTRAIELLRGRDPRNQATAHLHLATLEIECDRPDAAELQLHALESIGDQLLGDHQRDLAHLRAQLAAVRGDSAAQRIALRKAESLETDPTRRLERRLERALLDLKGQRSVSDLNRLISDAVAISAAATSRPLDSLVMEICAEAREDLAPATEAAVIAWAEERKRPSVAARLLHRRGRAEDAIALLRRDGDVARVPVDERLRCVHLLACLLPPEAADERWTCAVELEELLEEVADDPHVRLDVAVAMRMCADRDLARLRRAWTHAERALQGVANEPTIVAHAHAVMAGIALAFIEASLPSSTEEVAIKAAWLEGNLHRPAAELGDIRLAAASKLLVAGPLIHPEALATARRLLRLAHEDLRGVEGDATNALPTYEGRLAWVDARLAGQQRGSPGENGPFDDVPDWFVAIVSGRGDKAPIEDDAVETFVNAAWLVRADLHERLRNVLSGWQSARSTGPGSQQRILERFNGGVALLKKARMSRFVPDIRDTVTSARSLLDEATTLARQHDHTALFDCLVSRGNAWRMEPAPDLALALASYEEASRLDATRERRATLDKVHADALTERGHPEDLRRATKLVEAALAVRRDGYLRAEALATAARIAEVHPDLDDLSRVKTAAEHLSSATVLAPDQARPALRHLVDLLSDWERLAPEDDRPRRHRAELRRLYPDLLPEIAATGAAEESIEDDALGVFDHPAARAFFDVRSRLMTARERRAMPQSLADRVGADLLRTIEEQAAATSLVGRPEEMESLLRDRLRVEHGEAQAGELAAVALLTVHLTRLGRRTVSDARGTTDRAVEAILELPSTNVAAFLLRELGLMWSPPTADGNPVCDFALAAQLLHRAVALEGGPTKAVLETVIFLARAVRYSARGPGDEHLREAHLLYDTALTRARAAGDPNVLAGVLSSLSELEGQMGDGSRESRQRRSLVRLEEAVRTARTPELVARYQSHLAWAQGQLAFGLNDAECIQWLDKAVTTFAHVDPAQLDPDDRQHFEANRATCVAELALRRGDRARAIEIRRAEVARLSAANRPHALATAQHNLATTLFFGDATDAEVRDGLRLATEAAQVRTIDRDARHCWETCHDAGQAILQRLDSQRTSGLGMTTRQAWLEARRWLRQAVTAARALGRGQELASASFALCDLAAHTSALAEAELIAEEAWTSVRDAMPFLLLTTEYRLREAHHALRAAYALARLHGAEAVVGAAPDLAFLLVAERARAVECWLLRAQVPARRPLRARLAIPPGVSATTWSAWRAALESNDEARVAQALRLVRTEAPPFLLDDGDVTWASEWLRDHRDGAVVAAFAPDERVLVWLATTSPDGGRQPCILGLVAPNAPARSEELVRCLREAHVQPERADRALRAMGEWTRRSITNVITRILGRTPPAILWCPAHGLRLLPPGELWPGSDVSMTHALEGPTQRAYAGRNRSTLIALADPGPGSDHALGGGLALDRLAGAASGLGPVRLMASIGADFGRAVRDPAVRARASGLLDTPVAPDALLAAAEQHATIVIIAHGELTARGAEMLCLDDHGEIARLTEATLAAHPRAFAGSMVILLTCSAGQVTGDLADPGGLAGTLLTAGARCVVAPLWPVRLDVATEVAEVVLRGAACGDEPARALGQAQASHFAGAHAPDASPRTTAELSRLAFVALIG